ncbi:MAG: peptide-methionine (S)-S-oxide reductase MsrA [Bacteroidetes bacterium]|nr:peptide-methionine (S)-S-oxide reductase MsrA [Bacteroidota bacterium]
MRTLSPLLLLLLISQTLVPMKKTELATLGGGCFWCIEAVYQKMPGILRLTSGYSGGHVTNPTYEQVCTGTTGHAEVVQIEFDPSLITYQQILELFWKAHDPTTLNRQGNDTGTQYRSVIFFHTEEQERIAKASRTGAQKQFSDPIVTEIVPLKTFYKAEEYHQDYYRNNASQPYCRFVIKPKLDKLFSK